MNEAVALSEVMSTVLMVGVVIFITALISRKKVYINKGEK